MSRYGYYGYNCKMRASGSGTTHHNRRQKQWEYLEEADPEKDLEHLEALEKAKAKAEKKLKELKQKKQAEEEEEESYYSCSASSSRSRSKSSRKSKAPRKRLQLWKRLQKTMKLQIWKRLWKRQKQLWKRLLLSGGPGGPRMALQSSWLKGSSCPWLHTFGTGCHGGTSFGKGRCCQAQGGASFGKGRRCQASGEASFKKGR